MPFSLNFKQIVFLALVLGAVPGFSPCNNEADAQTQDTGKSEASRESTKTPEWAEAYLEDPIAEVITPSLEQLKSGLEDSARALDTLQLHFPRATTLTRDEQTILLRGALSHNQPAVRQEAAIQLERLGLLESTVIELLKSLALDRESNRKTAGLLGLAKLPPESLPRDPIYLERLIAALGDPDIATAQAAASQLVALGPIAVPWLIDALENSTTRSAAAEVLGTITRNSTQRPSGQMPGSPAPIPMKAAPGTEPREPATIAKSRFPGIMPPQAPDLTAPQTVRKIDQTTSPNIVRVYYGTNRAIEPQPTLSARAIVGPTTALIALIIISVIGISHLFRSPQHSEHRHFIRMLFLTLAIVAAAIWLVNNINQAAQAQYSLRKGVRFAGHRSENSTIHYGYCDVSIPPNHEVGQVESPFLGPEDEARHVVLKEATIVQEDEYFEELRKRLIELKNADSCFVFVHGYNVSFDTAAKRTAQIFYDLDFQGLPIFFSWPSRASIRHYFSDRNEVLFSRELIKKFLIQVAQRSGAKKINVIAHSMGADAVTQAIAAIDDASIVFDQIILAAPDIDAETFKQQLLPRLQQHGRRTTLYCSKNDLALHMSFHFNDSWRAGDSSRGLLLAEGLDTVDASMIDTELLGHSYYGSCLPLLRDFRDLFLHDHPPQDRNLISLPSADPLRPAWTFPQIHTSNDFLPQ